MICALTRGICVCAISEEEGSRAPIIAPDRFQCDSPGLECEPDPRPAQVACRAAWVQQRRAQSSQRAEGYRVPGTATPLAVSTGALISTTVWGQVQDCILYIHTQVCRETPGHMHAERKQLRAEEVANNGLRNGEGDNG